MLETPKWALLVNSEVPVEMPHNMSFHQGLHCLQRLKQFSGKEIQSTQVYCIISGERTHQNTMGYQICSLKGYNGLSKPFSRVPTSSGKW